MSKAFEMNRRTALKGLGTVLALPMLDAMLPGVAQAAPESVATTASGHPLRMAFCYVPNGMHMQAFTPKDEGAGYELPELLEPLKGLRDEFSILSGLTHTKANANGDGGGDHARAMSTFLTGCQAKKTHGADIRIGISVDQLAAQQIGGRTRFASLELGCDAGAQAGNCDSGYSCAYSNNLAWKSESTPVAKEINPKLVFERLFSNGNAAETAEMKARREKYNRSILDFVLSDARRLHDRVGAADRRKLDEYLTAVRELERRIAGSGRAVDTEALGFKPPAGLPSQYDEHIRLMGDLMVLAFQTDTTRIATFVLANEGSNKSYPQVEVPEGHHDLSHHGNDAKKHEKIKRINKFHLTQFAYIVERLKSVQEGSGSLLDNCMVIYGSGIGDGDRHNHNDLPILLAGKGGGTLATGRHVKFDSGTPLTNLYLSMLDRMGVKADRFGDSTGRLHGLEG